jgi:hypothetical protein
MRIDTTVASAVRRPSHAFLDRWLAELDRSAARRTGGTDTSDEALAFELLMLCHEYRLGVFLRTDRSASDFEAGDA